ncbi:MAG: Mov34/MPN/PAD-1 family protein [Candidatus Methanospirareceae archaeon]
MARKIKGIAKDTLDFILEVSKSVYPNEFVGLLSANGEIITEVFLLPGTLSSSRNAIIRMDMMPLSVGYVGSVHSHPHYMADKPSEQDLIMFSKTGNYHIITFYPYREEDWRCYNSKGEEKELEVVEW